MTSYRAHLRRLDRLHRLASEESRRLGLAAIAPEAFLLAIVHPDAGDSAAARALSACGLGRDELERSVAAHGSGHDLDGDPQLNPAAYMLMSRAEGIAAALGAAEVSAEHVLLAYLWDPSSEGQLTQLETSREAVRSRLAELGASLPQAELPSPDPRRWGPRTDVPIDQLWVLLGELPYVMPSGAQFIFNHDWKTGWFRLTEGRRSRGLRPPRTSAPPADSRAARLTPVSRA